MTINNLPDRAAAVGPIMEETVFDFIVLMWLAPATLLLAAGIGVLNARRHVRNFAPVRAATRSRMRSLRGRDD